MFTRMLYIYVINRGVTNGIWCKIWSECIREVQMQEMQKMGEMEWHGCSCQILSSSCSDTLYDAQGCNKWNMMQNLKWTCDMVAGARFSPHSSCKDTLHCTSLQACPQMDGEPYISPTLDTFQPDSLLTPRARILFTPALKWMENHIYPGGSS